MDETARKLAISMASATLSTAAVRAALEAEKARARRVMLAEIGAQPCPICGYGAIDLDDPGCPTCVPWHWRAKSDEIARLLDEWAQGRGA